MNVTINVVVYTFDDDTEVRFRIGSEYGGVETRDFSDPADAGAYIYDVIHAKHALGIKKIEERRSALVAKLAKAQASLERSGAA